MATRAAFSFPLMMSARLLRSAGRRRFAAAEGTRLILFALVRGLALASGAHLRRNELLGITLV